MFTSPLPLVAIPLKKLQANVAAQVQLRQLLAQPALVEIMTSDDDSASHTVQAITEQELTRYDQVKKWFRFSWLGLASLALAPLSTFAQTPPTAPAAFQTAVTNIVSMIKSIAGPAILLLIVAGFALIMWGGVSENWKRKGLAIIGCAVIGAALLFMFADPLAQFLAATLGASGGATAPRP